MAQVRVEDWTHIPPDVRQMFEWAAAAEPSGVVGTRGLLVGIMRAGDGVDEVSTLLEHFGVPREALFAELQNANTKVRFDPSTARQAGLADYPSLTANAQGAIDRAWSLQEAGRNAPTLGLAHVFGAILEAERSTAFRGLAEALRERVPLRLVAARYPEYLQIAHEAPFGAFLRTNFPRDAGDIELSQSVRGAADELTGEVTATALAGAILRRHPEYGAGRDRSLALDPGSGERRAAAEWLRSVRERLDPSTIPRLHGRAVIAGLARIDIDLRRQLDRAGFLSALEVEIDPPLDGMEHPPPPDTLAGYVSDALPAGGQLTDRLGVEQEANALASVLIARDVHPPLSVGLFGDWGTGKSFFMGLMQQRIKTLADLSQVEGADSAYCAYVKQIPFNAWHYADANLWASLVTRIFEGLGESSDDRSKIIGALEITRRQRETVQARAEAARESKDAAAQKLVRLQERRGVVTGDRRASSPQAVSEVAQDPAVVKATEQVEQALKQPAAGAAYEFIQTAGSLRRLGGLTRVLWRELLARYGKPVVVPAAVLGVAVFVALLALAVVQPDVLAALVAWLGLVGAAVRRPAKSVRAAEAAISGSLDQAHTRMKAEEDAAQHEHEAAAQAEREAEGDLAEIESGRHLATFIADRASASEYRARLGLIAAVREDFERLTGMLAEREAAATNGTAAAGATEGETPEAPLPRIQRVVLYIDDLDRCPAERVVEVLEAVHLLLAFELFVVVVGVDSRWLLNSLRRHYAAQLAVQADGDEAVAEAAHWASTPQNYLEKIFQIPYVLRRMDDKGFRRLVADLLASPASSAPSGAGEGTGDTAPQAHEPPPRPQYAMVTQRPGGPHDDSAPHAPTIASEIPRKPPEPPPVDLRPAALQFKQAEVDYLAGLCRLVTTPRAAKRLANTYRLVRAGLNGPELDRFTGADGSEGKYREVLLMLAALARSSSVGATLLGRIEALPGDAGWGDFLESLANADDSLHAAAEREDWQGFRTALAAIASADPRPLSIEHMKAWRLKVARFSFLAGMAHR